MKKKSFAVTIAILFTANVQADTVGLYLGGQIWQSEANGIFGEKNTPSAFTLKKEQQSSYFVAAEHPFPLLPNARISTTSLNTMWGTNSTQEFSDDDDTFYVNVHIDLDVDTNFNLSYVDYTLYYELVDNGLFSFDLGLTARDFNGAVMVTETKNIVTTSVDKHWDEEVHEGHNHPPYIETTKTVTTNKIKTDDIEPLIFIATNISLPLTGLNLFGQGDFSLQDDHSLYDYQVGLSYDLVDNRMVDLNLTLGYRAVKMEFGNLERLYTEFEFKGVFVGMIAHF